MLLRKLLLFSRVSICASSALFFSQHLTAEVSYKNFLTSFWVGPPASYVTPETYQTIKDANFTNCGLTWDYNVETNKKMLTYCGQLGMSAIVVDDRIAPNLYSLPNWKRSIDAVVRDYAKYPSLMSYYVMDEPGAALFTGLGEISKYFRSVDPKRLPYINLFPNYASSDQLDTADYRSYLEVYRTKVKPEVLSYDYYTFAKDNVERKTYFQNLGDVSDSAFAQGKPFWNTVLSADHLFYRRPNLGEMRWQVHSSLAYGANGILYFTYWPDPKMQAPDQPAVVDKNGKPTELYDIIKEVNLEAIRTAHVLEGYHFESVFHGGTLPLGTKPVPANFPLEIGGQNALVAQFSNNSQKMWMVMNRDFKQDTSLLVQLPDSMTNVEVFDSKANTWIKETIGASHSLEVNLEAGYGKLLRPLN